MEDPQAPDTATSQLTPRLLRVALGCFTFLLILAIYPHTSDPTGDIKWLLVAWTALGLGLFWLVGIAWFEVPLRRPTLFLEVLLLLLLFFAIATVRSDFLEISLAETARFLFLFLLYLLATQAFAQPAQVRRWMAVLCVAVALASLYGYAQRLGYDPIDWADQDSDVYTNLPSTFGNPNFAAHVLILTIIASVYLWRSVPGSLWWLVTLVCGGHFLLTQQRAGWVALAVACVLVVVASRFRSTRRPVLATLATVCVSALLVIAGAAAVMFALHLRTGTPFPLDPSLLLRYQSYLGATSMILDAPLLGHGPGVYALINPLYWTWYEQHWFAQELRMNAHVHNDSLELAIDAGLPAAGLYLLLLSAAVCHGLSMAFSAPDRGRRLLGYAFAALFAAFLVDGLFGFNLRVPASASMLFLLLGALDGLSSPAVAGVSQDAPRNARPAALLWRTALAGVLLFAVLLESRVYASKYVLRRGLEAAGSGHYDEAQALMATSRALAPWRHRSALWQGRLAHEAGRYGEALRFIEQALALSPHAIDLYLAAAQAAMAASQTAGHSAEETRELLGFAQAHTEQALELCPMLPQAHEILGKANAMRAINAGAGTTADDAWEEAEGHLLLAIQYGASNPADLYGFIAQIRVRQDRPTQAEEAHVRAVQAQPTSAEAWSMFMAFAHEFRRYNRIQNTLYSLLGRLEEQKADRHLMAALYLRLAEVLENNGGSTEALEDTFRAAARHAPDRPEVWAHFGRHAVAQRRLEPLRTAIARSVALSAARDEALPIHVAAIDALFRDGPQVLDNATTALAALVRAHPQESPLSAAQQYGWAAQILLNVADRTEVVPCGVYFNLAIVCAGIENLSVAERLFGQAAPCLPAEDRPYLATHWAETLARLGREEEALAKLEAARSAYPESLDIQWQYARLLAQAGRVEAARLAFDRLLTLPDLEEEARRQVTAERDALEAPGA